MDIDLIKNRILKLGSDVQLQCRDLTGTRNHFEAKIVSNCFEGKSTLERHRMVLGLFQKELESGDLHALSLKVKTFKEHLGGKK